VVRFASVASSYHFDALSPAQAHACSPGDAALSQYVAKVLVGGQPGSAFATTHHQLRGDRSPAMLSTSTGSSVMAEAMQRIPSSFQKAGSGAHSSGGSEESQRRSWTTEDAAWSPPPTLLQSNASTPKALLLKRSSGRSVRFAGFDDAVEEVEPGKDTTAGKLTSTPPWPSALWSGTAVSAVMPRKNTFIHFDADDKSPAVAKIRTSPEASLLWGGGGGGGAAAPPPPQPPRCSHPAPAESYESSPCSSACSDQDDDVTFVLGKRGAMDRWSIPTEESWGGQSAVRLSSVLAQKRAGHASAGSELHAWGRCLPCLMQCRYASGRCTEPCKFGHLCNRCHEDHGEDELQHIQCQMRRQRRRSGGGGRGGHRPEAS